MTPCIRVRLGLRHRIRHHAGARRRPPGSVTVLCAAVLVALVAAAAPAHAQEELDDIFGGLGTAQAIEEGEARPEAGEGEGTLAGQVFDGESGAPVAGVTVIVIWPPPEDGSEARQEVQITDAGGGYEFPAIPAGRYTLSFVKAGYRASDMTGFEVQAGQANRADFPLPPIAAASAEEVLQLDAFVVEASTVSEIMASLELRMESDQLLDIMSAEDLSRYAAGDVAEAMKRVAGVNVVEGKFAIIRGLEDRYSSTTYNRAPIPSPDPDKQSVQLDLFPSEVVHNLVVSKNFAPDLPSNSSGGSIDIVTHAYPETPFEAMISAGAGFNDRARDRFLELESRSFAGNELDAGDVIESEYSASLGGRSELLGRELRGKVVLHREIDYETLEGFQESREPRLVQRNRRGVIRAGDLSLGELNLSAGRWDLTQSEYSEQETGYLGLGLDLDEKGQHLIDGSIFYTRKREETVELRENAYLPNFDYGTLVGKDSVQFGDFEGFATPGSPLRQVRELSTLPPERGPLWSTSFLDSVSVDTERELLVGQLGGAHEVGPIEGLSVSWAANYARTTQDEEAVGALAFFEPEDVSQVPTQFPVTVASLGPGSFATNGVLYAANEIEEDQWFGRLDARYEQDLLSFLAGEVGTGIWIERGSRDVEAKFLETQTRGGTSSFAIVADSFEELGRIGLGELDSLPGDPDPQGTRENTNEANRKIDAWHVGGKLTFWEDVDLLGGVRLEQIFIESLNDPFTGEIDFTGSPGIYPNKFLLFDRLDNPARNEAIGQPPFNDQILGIDVPVDPVTGFVDLTSQEELDALVNGEIDETKVLPSAGLAYRPLEGLVLRGAWSQTVARPSFREMGYYVSVEPGNTEIVVGNPQLELSEVESWDARAEYTWGALGDLVAVSTFYKTIDQPIESLLLFNPVGGVLYRTFFNNPNEATLWGIEAEARKSLDFLYFDFLEYLSIGGNYTWIDAEVGRSEEEISRSVDFFGVPEGDPESFTRLAKSRRLFGQPEWIANADLTFDHPDWGTRFTLAWFAISDVLDAAGTGQQIGSSIGAFTLDRYVDSFHQLDLIASQRFSLPIVPGEFALKFSAKNLTDSKRKILYDPEQTREEIAERAYRVGRDYSLSLQYRIEFGGR